MKTQLTPEQLLQCAAAQQEYWKGHNCHKHLYFIQCMPTEMDLEEEKDRISWDEFIEMASRMAMHFTRMNVVLADLKRQGISKKEALLAEIPNEPSEYSFWKKQAYEAYRKLSDLNAPVRTTKSRANPKKAVTP